MTYEEALKEANSRIAAVEEAIREWDANVQSFAYATLVFLETVKSATEKQIPKKPMIITKGVYISGYCPSCGAKQLYGDLPWHKVFNKYCLKCGQALDWSNKK